MKVTSLFSGAGGMDVGLHQAGHDLLLLCDSDAGARQVLRQAFPGVRIHDDVISLEKLPEETELLVAGFPCVDVSRAGLRKGLEGQSTGLVRHVFRLLQAAKDDRRPVPWVLLENVEALLDRHGGDPPVMQYCAQKFIELGYQSWAYRVVNSAGFGVPNRRRRVFMVASMHGDARDVLLAQGSQKCSGGCVQLFGGRRCYPCHAQELRNMRHHTRVSYALDMGNAMSPAGEDVVPTFTTSNERMLLLLAEGASGMLRVEDAERLQGLPVGHTRPCWPVQTPGVGAHRSARMRTEADAEAASSKRWDLLGNAVTAPVARWLGERLAAPYQYKYHGVSSGDKPLEHLLVEGAPAEAAAALRSRPLHPWSYVASDQLQDALIFEYLSIAQRKREVARRRRRRERLSAAAAAAAAGDENADALMAVVDAPEDPSLDAGSSDDGEELEEGSADEAADAALMGAEGEAAEVLAVARAARRAAAAERAAAAHQEQEAAAATPAPAPAPPATPCDDAPLPNAPSAEATTFATAGSTGHASDDSGETSNAATGAAAAVAEATPGGAGEEATAQRRLARAEAEAEQKELFQAAIVRRKERGKVQQQARQQTVWDRDAWPRAAWWVRGLGCFGCEEMSECPVPAPFVPLGEFISEVGREASQQEIHTYLHRMREKGWDVNQTIEKLLKNGTRISAEAHAIVRIPGLLTDADMIGDIVWAKDRAAHCWWPCEKLDPLHMPAGRDLPPGALRALTADEKLVSLPQYQALAAKVPQEQRHEDRRVLVIFLPISSGQWKWVRPSSLESFEGNGEREREASNLIRSNGGRWKHGDEMVRALKDARASLYVKQHKNNLEAERMRRTRASAAAGAINLKQRCGQCKTCMNNFAGQRRYDCLTQRMKAAALSGHAGAQVGINGEGAVGARVQVWWEGDQTFYSGLLAHYDPVSTEHTVCYDDGEVGMHRLWQHDERIRLASPVEQWPRDAVLARHLLAQAQEKLRNRDVGRRASGGTAAAAGAAPAPAEGGKATPYAVSTEELRRKNREAFEMFMGSAAKGLEATGAVPDLTAHEQEVLAAAQQAARAAATHRRSGGGAAAGGSKGYRGKDSATEPVAAEATAGGSAGDNGTAFRFFEEASAAATPITRGSKGAGPSRKRRASTPPSEEEGDESGKDDGDSDARPVQARLHSRMPRIHLEKCGQCKHCLNPRLKKACKVVLLQRQEMGMGLRSRD